MDSLPTIYEDALLEDYEEAMELEDPGVLTGAVPTPSTSQVHDMKATEVVATVVDDAVPTVPVTLPAGVSPNGETVIAASVSPNGEAVVATSTAASSSALSPQLKTNEASGSNSGKCRICNKSHNLRACRTFGRMSYEQRIRMVLVHRYCSCCLSPHHIARDCKSTGHCKKCMGKHHTFLHSPSRSVVRKNASTNSSRKPTALPSNFSQLPVRQVVTFSPTAKVLLLIASRSIPVRAILDLCCSTSYICADLVAKLKLPVIAFGDERVCRVSIRSVYDASKVITVTVKVKKFKGIFTPLESVPVSIKEKFEGMQLADPDFNVSGRVALVLGPEVAPQILKDKIYSNPGFPMAQYTIFGWVISGQSPYS